MSGEATVHILIAMSRKDIKRILAELPPRAAEAITAGGDWEGEEGKPYLLIFADLTWSSVVLNDYFRVSVGVLEHAAFMPGEAWTSSVEVENPRYGDWLLEHGREGALRGAEQYLEAARRTGKDPLAILAPPERWEFQVAKIAETGLWRLARARPESRAAWYTFMALPENVKEHFGIPPSDDTGTLRTEWDGEALAGVASVRPGLLSAGDIVEIAGRTRPEHLIGMVG